MLEGQAIASLGGVARTAAIACVLLNAIACGARTGLDFPAGSGQGGLASASTTGSQTPAASSSSTGYPPGCNAALPGAKMVELLTADGHKYCIDSTETTDAEYAVFLAANVDPAAAAKCAPGMGWTPVMWPVTAAHMNDPVIGVGYCQADAYCKWAGKRLCGRIGGGANPVPMPVATEDEWLNACTHGGTQDHPYGKAVEVGACNINSSGVAPVGSFAQCEGGYPGLFDMEGNAPEATAGCDYSANVPCFSRGGAYVGGTDQSCWTALLIIGIEAGGGGIRCCRDDP